MNVSEIIAQTENKRLELKEAMPTKSDLAKTIEVSNPGGLMPLVDFNVMDAGQSNIRNKVLAPVFKQLGIIEQWGNGLRIISEEMEKYPEIHFEWKEIGLGFRVIFSKKEVKSQPDLQPDLISKNTENRIITKSNNRLGDRLGNTLVKITELMTTNPYISIPELSKELGISTTAIEKNIARLKKLKIIRRIGSSKSGEWLVKP